MEISKMKTEKVNQSDFMLSSLIYKQKSCEVCSKKHNQAKMILCDRCQDAFHIKCINLSKIPEGTWVCRQCMIDISNIKQTQTMNKKPSQKNHAQQCSGCKQRINDDYFAFEIPQEGKVLFQAKYIRFVKCIYCGDKYHSTCFSDRPQAINCRTCQDTIRQMIPKGHTQYVKFLTDSKNKIARMNYLQLWEGFSDPKYNYDTGCLAPMDLNAPTKPRDWRVITAYEASLCYALISRDMIYCENLVVELKPQRLETVMRGHQQSVEKIHRLHRTDEVVYQTFKSNLQKGCLPPLQVKQDRRKGFYLASTDRIPANTIIAQYTGQVITARQSLNMITNESIFTLIRNPRSYDSLDIAPSRFANIGIFISGINNNDVQSSELQNVKALKFLYKGIAKLILVTIRDIMPKETLYLNYNGDRAVSQYPTSSFVL